MDDNKENEPSGGSYKVTPIYWPIFFLHGNGNVYCFLTGLGDNAIYQPDIIGPLPFFPQAEDNYDGALSGGGDYKAILCLSPVHSSSPPILVTANNKTVYHAIVLNDQKNEQYVDEADTDTESQTGN